MCGAFETINNPFTNSITEALGVPEVESRGIRAPASMIQIVTEDENDRYLEDAKWWLLLGADGKPNYKYATFNSRYDKLYTSSLTKGAFRTSRCLIPASGFIEGQSVGQSDGKNKQYHHITSERGAVALAGIYKQYQVDGEVLTTASVITCPGNPKFEQIHRKSIPLMLDIDDESLVDRWLDPTMTDSESFRHLLTNKINVNLVATPTVGARDMTPRGEPVLIEADR
ncbi:SOS response-associated peptidase family protein [Marinicella litoralis]|uniref:Abasic site processing protein n=1 Tax=Marinicella litoralis TaxID=644220 RepID=A0A4R6X6I7_9GAMM|nr:SOS response-associated peptidase family protein [Marinicella litoralis]TDR14662.1 putative SOS response-associated peptidase YedK [Marinicella litoralis]